MNQVGICEPLLSLEADTITEGTGAPSGLQTIGTGTSGPDHGPPHVLKPGLPWGFRGKDDVPISFVCRLWKGIFKTECDWQIGNLSHFGGTGRENLI